MILSYRWLSELVDLGDRTPEQIADTITFHIAEVEGVEHVGKELEGVVVGHVTDVQPHPDADRLRVCTVNDGSGADHTVVCGAPNVAAGQRVCFAPVGTTLEGPDGPITLERRAIRGVESAGMICAEDELGLGEDHSGIVVLSEDAPIGEPIGTALRLSDTLIEVDNKALTHRPDLWGHVGFARDLGTVLRADVTFPTAEAAEASLAAAEGEPYDVQVEDEEGCRRYVGLVLDGVSNGRAPLWMRRRLELLGIRSIDLLVDLTNYVLLEQGQPLHAFDLRDLKGDCIRVRRGREGEVLRSLDGIDRQVGPEDVVIADVERPVALAGVMGGEDSGMRADTGALLLEAATFDPVRVRRTAARVGLRTESSTRFEKSLDPEQARAAALRFAELVLAHCPDSRVARPVSDCYPRPFPATTVDLPYTLLRRRLGLRLNDMRIKSILTRLGFKSRDGRKALHVDVPSWRATKDIEEPEDLVEEVGRIAGYHDLPVVAPITTVGPTPVPAERALKRRLASALSMSLGYTEVKRYSFYGAKDVDAFGLQSIAHIRLSHPLSEEQDRLAQTTAVNLLKVVQRNMNRVPAARAWESTRLFGPGNPGELPSEDAVLGMVAWNVEDDDAEPGALLRSTFADVRTLLDRVGIRRTRTHDADVVPIAADLPAPTWLHPGRCGHIHTRTEAELLLAVGGEIAPSVMRRLGVSGRVVVVELNLENVLSAAAHGESGYTPVLRYPVVPFDVSLLVPRRTPAERVEDVIENAVEGNVRGVQLFDAYEGEGIPEGQRSLAFTCELFDRERTLTSDAAESLRGRIIDALTGAGWHVRTK